MKIIKIKNPPKGTFPPKLSEKWEKVYDSILKKNKGDKKAAAALTWYIIKKGWRKSPKTGKWVEIKNKKVKLKNY